ncbi:MAG: YeeE/YedE thiosulfate transporter family protein [Bacteroidales bacterium]|jgi:hypothetical protein|nr:YeeE/YedE thiosulfate transporter family protein [Bacteroidales bacterium]
MESFISTGLINSEWSSVFAVGIGGAIGFVLESSGFSSSRKVAGTFYGYDFTSLRVFLMAGITSLIGLLYMDFFGWIDFFSFNIPDTYIWPTLLGSIFMGVGFVASGFCPGTSILSAAIGKLDGWIFIGSTMVGIFLFTILFPLLEPIYNAGNLGAITITDVLGLSSYVYAFIVTLIVIALFYLATLIRRRKTTVKY